MFWLLLLIVELASLCVAVVRFVRATGDPARLPLYIVLWRWLWTPLVWLLFVCFLLALVCAYGPNKAHALVREL